MTGRAGEVLSIKSEDVHGWLAREIDELELATKSDVEHLADSFTKALNAFKAEYHADRKEEKRERLGNRTLLISSLIGIISLLLGGIITLLIYAAH